MLKQWVVILKLARLPVSGLIARAIDIVKAMSDNAYFPNPTPALSYITHTADALQQAAAEAADGGKTKNIIKQQKRDALVRLLMALANYVENIANENPEKGDEIITSAGIAYKNVAVHTAKEFQAKHGKMPGEAKLRTKHIRNAAFIWQFTLTPDDEQSWTQAAITNKASIVLSGLTSVKRYYFRVAVVSGNRQGPWSNVVELVVL